MLKKKNLTKKYTFIQKNKNKKTKKKYIKIFTL